MTDILSSYKQLDHSSPRTSVTTVLRSIVTASPIALDPASRAVLVQLLLDDTAAANGKTRLTVKDLPYTLLAIKMLGRNPDASQVIVSEPNLKLLYSIIANLLGKYGTDVTNEALRCIANALLLQESGRGGWRAIGGGELCLTILDRNSSTEEVFLVSRILFLITLQASEFLEKAVHDLNIVEILSLRLDITLGSLIAGKELAKEALIDLLKSTFNLMIQYPRMMQDTTSESPKGLGELWDDRFESLLPPLLRIFHHLPATSPAPLQSPRTHVIHALLNVPVAPLASKWFASTSTPPVLISTTPPTAPRTSPSDTFHKALSRLTLGNSTSSASRRSLSSSRSSASRPTSPSTSSQAAVPVDTLRKLYDIFDATLAYYISFDPDDSLVRKKCRDEDVVLDEVASPLSLLLGRLAHGDLNARSRLRGWLLPPDLNRDDPLEKRTDLLGRCIRLMACVHHQSLKNATGELLFVICNEDSSTLSAQIGYGNAAGFLFSKGMMAPPSDETDANGVPLNPITGTTRRREPSTVDMTNEEKEREAERLFVLFDRLERSGMGVNPVRAAMQEGRFEELPEDPEED